MITVEKTQDEFGQDRFYVDRDGDWIAGPFDTYEEAAEAAEQLKPGRGEVKR